MQDQARLSRMGGSRVVLLKFGLDHLVKVESILRWLGLKQGEKAVRIFQMREEGAKVSQEILGRRRFQAKKNPALFTPYGCSVTNLQRTRPRR